MSLRALMERHGLDCEKASRTPPRLARALAGLGFGDHNFPPPHLRFYDTLQLLLATGIAEGGSVRYLRARAGGIVHVGGATRQRL